MQSIEQGIPENQAANFPQRKKGVEVVTSANLAKRFFHGPSRFRGPATLSGDDEWRRRVERASRQ